MARTKSDVLPIQPQLQLAENFALPDAIAMLKEQIRLCDDLSARMKNSINSLHALGEKATVIEMSTIPQDVYKIYPCFKITL